VGSEMCIRDSYISVKINFTLVFFLGVRYVIFNYSKLNLS